jgi:hypothetical protein
VSINLIPSIFSGIFAEDNYNPIVCQSKQEFQDIFGDFPRYNEQLKEVRSMECIGIIFSPSQRCLDLESVWHSNALKDEGRNH